MNLELQLCLIVCSWNWQLPSWILCFWWCLLCLFGGKLCHFFFFNLFETGWMLLANMRIIRLGLTLGHFLLEILHLICYHCWICAAGTDNSDQARDVDLPLKERFYLQPKTPQEAADRVKVAAQEIIDTKPLIARKAWPYVQNGLRSSASYLRYDLNTIVASKPKDQRKSLKDLTAKMLAALDNVRILTFSICCLQDMSLGANVNHRYHENYSYKFIVHGWLPLGYVMWLDVESWTFVLQVNRYHITDLICCHWFNFPSNEAISHHRLIPKRRNAHLSQMSLTGLLMMLCDVVLKN